VPEKLKLYLDQMIQAKVARALQFERYDVLRASDIGQNRFEDHKILETSISLNRILVTLDDHFGDWTILPLHKHPGVIRVKANPTTSDNIIRILIPFIRLHSRKQFNNNLVIVSLKNSKWIRTA